MENYDDILCLPHHVSVKHSRMSMLDRAAQFSPFAALTGYEEAIEETGRLTDSRIELGEYARELLDRKQQILSDLVSQAPFITISYFIPDSRKDGGTYTQISGNLKRIDPFERMIYLTNGIAVALDLVINIESDCLSEL